MKFYCVKFCLLQSDNTTPTTVSDSVSVSCQPCSADSTDDSHTPDLPITTPIDDTPSAVDHQFVFTLQTRSALLGRVQLSANIIIILIGSLLLTLCVLLCVLMLVNRLYKQRMMTTYSVTQRNMSAASSSASSASF